MDTLTGCLIVLTYQRVYQIPDILAFPVFLSRLPNGIVKLRNLTILGLNDMSLSELPSDFGCLENLESLELRENLIKYLPESMPKLTKLERLGICEQ